MYQLSKPSDEALEALAKRAKGRPLSTPRDPLSEQPQHAWSDDRYQRELLLPAQYEKGALRAALRERFTRCDFFPRWMMARRFGDLVIVGTRLMGVWGVFPDRIIREHDEGDDERFSMGFTYATVKGHFETGIESFEASKEGPSAPLLFTIRAISRADNPVKGVISALWVRALQRRFGEDTPRRFEEELQRALTKAAL